MLAAMMSSLAAVFNSASTVFTIDIYKRFVSPAASEKVLVVVGQLATVACVLLGLLWIPVMKSQTGQLYMITQKVGTHLSPTLTTVFILGIFWWRTNHQGKQKLIFFADCE